MARKRELLEVPEQLDEARFWSVVGSQESDVVEFKESIPKPTQLQEPLVAFANSQGGMVVLGVSSGRPHKVIGVNWAQDHEERVQDALRSTQPPLAATVAKSAVDGKTVVFVQVERPEAGWIHTSNGRLLIRAGPTNRALVGEDLARFIKERGSLPPEDEAVRGVGIDDLDPAALRTYLQERLARSRIKVAPALNDVGLTNEDGQVRLATLLLFGKEPQASARRLGIVFMRMEGSVGAGAKLRERIELTGPLPGLVADADRLIYREMRRDAVIRGLIREEVPEFPPPATREALLNAVGHRDYSLRGSAVEVRLFDDALEIESPGTLPAHVTVDNLRDVQYSRNPRIMDAFERLHLVEEAGTGIDRMIQEMEDALLDPPQFEEKSASFVVRLRGTSVFLAEDRLWIGDLADIPLSSDAKLALVYARRNGHITNEQLRNLRHLDRDASRAVLQDLVARDLLRVVGRGRGARYVLGDIAAQAHARATVPQQFATILSHAERAGSVANADVRGLLGIDRDEARELLAELTRLGYLEAVGERRGRRYLPTPAAQGPT
jgi:ATP-dependent DNA helicase RecG